MTITVRQTCNGCGASRELKAGYYGQPATLAVAAKYDGWRELDTDVHLCPDCIRAATSQIEDK